MADLGQMDADLMRSTCLGPAFHQHVIAQFLYRPYMGNRTFAHIGQFSAAADAVAAVANQIGLNGLFFDIPMYDGQIATFGGVLAELMFQMPFERKGFGQRPLFRWSPDPGDALAEPPAVCLSLAGLPAWR